jgi:hypothetical protein
LDQTSRPITSVFGQNLHHRGHVTQGPVKPVQGRADLIICEYDFKHAFYRY